MDNKLNMNEEAREEKVEIESGEGKLDGKLFLPAQMKEKNPAALFLHGWRSEPERNYDLGKELSEDEFMSLVFSMRGHGKEGGDPNNFSRKDFLEDAMAGYDVLANDRRVDPERISVIGSSFGAYLGALLTKERKVQNLILRAPANYPDQGFDQKRILEDKKSIMEWRGKKASWNEVRSLASLHGFQGKVLIVESGKDEIISSQTIESYEEAVPKDNLSHIVMEDALHTISKDPDQARNFNRIVREWIRKNK